MQHRFWTRDDSSALQGKPTVGPVSTRSWCLQVRAGKAQVPGLHGKGGFKQGRGPTDTELHFSDAPTTTLPSEGHQNVLVNAAFVLPRGGGGVRPRMCFYSPNNSARWGLVRGWKGLMWYFKEAVVHLHAFTFGLTRCESLQRGVNAPSLQLECGTWRVNWSWAEQKKTDARTLDVRAACKNGFCAAKVWIK